jgi:hypothetical protein
MKFTLQKKEVGKALTVFNVLDDKGAAIGSVSVPNEEAASFVQHWKGAYRSLAKPAGTGAMAKTLMAKRTARTAVEARAAALRS